MYAAQRQRLQQQLPARSAVILTTNDQLPSNEDGTMRFIPSTSLFYLTGIAQDDTMLILCPDHPEPAFREVLFTRPADEQFLKWHGRRLTPAQASEISGITAVYDITAFESILRKVAAVSDQLYLYSNEHSRATPFIATKEDRLVDKVKSMYPLHQYQRLYPLLARQRAAKTPEELAHLQKACDITGAGFRRVLQFVRPGVIEKQVEAEMIHEYMQYGATWADYTPIVAAGADTCILHYVENNKRCQDGDLLLIDAAAGWQCYNADMTRTIPVNGRYSPRQKEIYNEVLHVLTQIRDYTRPGLTLPEIFAFSNALLLESLVRLSLCTTNDIKERGEKYYLNKHCYHNCAHFLGLDVHDVGYFHEPLPIGAVITNEPGIYCEAEGIGVRIENNLAITDKGCKDLMADIPVTVAEIEDLMNRGK